jgi:hypothetical protein
LKVADAIGLPRLVSRVWFETMSHGCFTGIFGTGVVLVPVPGSAPARGAPWVGERLACCFRELGLAAEVWPVLQRRSAVRKSAFAPAGERPSVLEHYASFALDRAALGQAHLGRDTRVRTPREQRLQLTLVDDVITRGRTVLAAAMRLRELFPAAEIRAFAVLRTLGRNEPLSRLPDPCAGEVRWISGDARRVP